MIDAFVESSKIVTEPRELEWRLGAMSFIEARTLGSKIFTLRLIAKS